MQPLALKAVALQQQACFPANVVLVSVQPLAVDWRDKIKGKRKATHSSASATSPITTDAQDNSSADAAADNAAASMTADGKPDLDLLTKGLPAGWRAMWDRNTGDIYYGNLKTRVRISQDWEAQPVATCCSL